MFVEPEETMHSCVPVRILHQRVGTTWFVHPRAQVMFEEFEDEVNVSMPAGHSARASTVPVQLSSTTDDKPSPEQQRATLATAAQNPLENHSQRGAMEQLPADSVVEDDAFAVRGLVGWCLLCCCTIS